MKVGGQIPRNVTPVCETSDLLSDGKTPYERRFGQPFKKDRLFHLVHWLRHNHRYAVVVRDLAT